MTPPDFKTKKKHICFFLYTGISCSWNNISFARYVPGEFLNFLHKREITEVQLGDQIECEITILFTDIRSFTTISETMTPEKNFSFLNRYLGVIGPIVRKNNGFIDKYIGDAVMALFPEKPEDAIQTASEMIEKVKDIPLKYLGTVTVKGKKRLQKFSP